MTNMVIIYFKDYLLSIKICMITLKFLFTHFNFLKYCIVFSCNFIERKKYIKEKAKRFDYISLHLPEN